jgi:hypothetical protein
VITVGVTEQFIQQLDEIWAEWDALRAKSGYSDLSDLPDNKVVRLVTRARAAVHRIAGPRSAYIDQCEECIKAAPYLSAALGQLIGVVDSLRADLRHGYLDSVSELIHGAVFGDFLEMAQHLLDEGYKDAAAVIAGSTLEAHLRKLCDKAGVDPEIHTNGQVRPKKADHMNSDLAKSNAYSKLDQKNVTAWLDLRNKAAHGQYNEYNADQVVLLISAIREFVTRNPA